MTNFSSTPSYTVNFSFSEPQKADEAVFTVLIFSTLGDKEIK